MDNDNIGQRLKDKAITFGINKNQPSLLNQPLLDDDELLNDSRDHIQFNNVMLMNTNREVEKEPDFSKETPLRKVNDFFKQIKFD